MITQTVTPMRATGTPQPSAIASSAVAATASPIVMADGPTKVLSARPASMPASVPFTRLADVARSSPTLAPTISAAVNTLYTAYSLSPPRASR